MPARITELVFKGSNRSVIRALDEIANKSQRTASTVKRDSEKQAAGFKAMGESAGRLHGAVSGLAGTVGFGGLAFGIASVVKGGERFQVQQAQLQGALKTTGQYSVDTMKQLNEAADRLSTRGGFGAVENVHALTLLQTATKSTAKSIRDMGLATDISRRTGKDYSTTVRAIMMLENGRTTGLARLGLAIPKVTTAVDALHAQYKKAPPLLLAQAKAQDALATKQQAIASLQARFAGATDAFSKTTSGRISNMNNSWKALQEQLGAGLLPVMNKIVTVVAGLVGWLNKHRIVLYGLLAALALVTGVLTTHAIITEVAKAKTIVFAGAQRLLALATGEAVVAEEGATGATVGLGAAMTALPIVALIGGLIFLGMHFKQTKQVAIELWYGIEDGAKAVVSALGSAFKAVYDVITWPFREAWKLIQGIYHKITNIPSMIVHGAGSILHTLSFGLLHTGGMVRPKYMAMGGPMGTDTVPGWLTPGEGVVNTRGMSVLGSQGLNQLNAGALPGASGSDLIELHHQTILDGQVLTDTVTRYVRKRAARGSSSLVGGGLMTGRA